MSVKELTISDAPIYFKFTEADNIEGAIKIKAYFGYDAPRAEAVIDRHQAHLLKIWLEEHLNEPVRKPCGCYGPAHILGCDRKPK